MTSFAELADWGEERLRRASAALVAADGPELNVYRWWEPGMHLPAAYMWQEAVGETQLPDSCTVRDDVRLVFCFATEPAQHEGADMLSIEQVIDTALPVIDAACKAFARRPGIRATPKRAGWRQVFDRWAGEGTERPLVLEVPVVIPWHRNVQPEDES